MFARIVRGSVLTLGASVILLSSGGCPIVTPPQGDPAAFTNANLVRGGLLYDEWWAAAGVAEPTGDQPLWASRPDTTSNTRSGKDTWRCKECHGWDYIGVDGAYGSGSHRTGIAGIAGTTKSAQEIFDLIKTAHGFGAAGLSDADIWDLAKFVKQGVIDTNTIIDADKSFRGSATTGESLYTNGIGSNIACAVCHAADGRQINFATDPEKEFIGTIAVDNPWELQHKIRFGQPGTAMPSAITGGGTNQDVADVGAYAQTLPTE